MSPTKHTNTTKRTSRLSDKGKETWLTTWQAPDGVRHLALAKRERTDLLHLVDVFTPCDDYTRDALDNTSADMAVTCVACLASKFAVVCARMNLAAIDLLNEGELLEHFVDFDAMSILYDPW